MTTVIDFDRVDRAGLDVAAPIAEFVESALSETGRDADAFWRGFAELLDDLTPRNEALLRVRDELQARIDDYHREHPGRPDPDHYRAFLTEIGYLLPEPEPFTITTADVAEELRSQPGPQLVVPLLNARFAINAANARWGSLYDALYGTDVVPDTEGWERGAGYNAQRGAEVIRRGRAFLDSSVPLEAGSHAAVRRYRIRDGALEAELADGSVSQLRDRQALAGFIGAHDEPSSILLRHHGLHVEIVVDAGGATGREDAAGVQDIVLESAVTTIMDLEDSVAAVDAQDKALGYRNWRGLLDGTLATTLTKNGRTFERTLNADRTYSTPDGGSLTLPGRSLLFVRNVGHLMRTDAVRDRHGADVFEGMLDAVMTALGALTTLRRGAADARPGRGSMYIVKPKMHGPEEVALTVDLFGRTEELLGLAPGTLKIGIMDEERRTTVTLGACIAAASDRVVFINTGFLDRTGDDIHTSFHAGPMRPKAEMRTQPFMRAYEASNVDTALRAGFAGRAQIGKGMWAMPDLMREMLEQKVAQLEAGATTAWVPSPTAATLHALHYHQVDVIERQRELSQRSAESLSDILIPPLLDRPLTDDERAAELDTDVQSILGYVVRWVDQGIGCSKVPDLHGVALMEDRATLRISSQLLANWLCHGIITEAEVDESLARLSSVVDAQNADDPAYGRLIGENGPGLAFEAARRLIIDGGQQPNGYTEPLLHELRRRKKALLQRTA